MKLIFLSSRKRPFLPRICKYVHSLAKVVHIFANILTNFWQTLQVSVCSSPPVQDRRQNRAGTRPSRGFPWPGHHDNHNDDDRGDDTFNQRSFLFQHVPHSLLFSWWQPSPGSRRRSYCGDVVSKALSFWSCSRHFGTFFKTCSAVGRSWRRSCRNMAPGMMWTRFYSLWKKWSGKRSIGHDFHFSCLPFFKTINENKKLDNSFETWKFTPASSKYFTMAGSSFVVAMCRTFSP